METREHLHVDTRKDATGVGRRTERAGAEDFQKSYGYVRLSIGLLALALPIALILVDWLVTTDDRFLTDRNEVRDSMSAYYHTAARDVFVGGLVTVGLLLITYRLGHFGRGGLKRTSSLISLLTNIVSLLAGILVMVVAFFPTGREISGDPSRVACTFVNGCTALQQEIGEHDAAVVHGTAAILFTVCLLLLCLLFLWEEKDASGSWTSDRNRVHLLATALIVCSGVVLALGMDIPDGPWGFALAEVYLAELLAFGGFAISWLAVARQIIHGADAGRRVTAVDGFLGCP